MPQNLILPSYFDYLMKRTSPHIRDSVKHHRVAIVAQHEAKK